MLTTAIYPDPDTSVLFIPSKSIKQGFLLILSYNLCLLLLLPSVIFFVRFLKEKCKYFI
jgi:hypothetical protein